MNARVSGSAGERDASGAVSTLARAVERLAGAGSPEQVADIVGTAARQLSGADGIAVVLREGGRVRYVDEDAVLPLWKGGAFPIESCISGWCIANRQRVVIPDVFEDERIPHHLYRPTFVRSCVMTPVGLPEPIACIGAYWGEVRQPTDQELESLDAIARATAVALENVRLHRSLRAALRRAEALDRVKSDFLTHMSHEIRTPLNGVIGALALLQTTELAPAQTRLLEMLRASGADLEQVLKGILDFARLQSEAAEIQARPFHVGDALREAASLYEARFACKGLALQVEVAPDAERWAVGDRGAVRHVLTRLIDNALKFTQRGGAVVSLAADDADRLRFTVADTGVGISADEQERIFDGFEQADASSTRAVGGLGLGLAIARRLVELMDGSLSVVSRPGEGACFTVVLALPAAASPASDLAPAQARKWGALRVLVVDDHPTNRAILSALLGSIGAEVVEAADGAQACDAFEAQRFDAVVMDIQMPVLDGLQATLRIRQIERTQRLDRTPIIVLSANALPEHEVASREAGADRHLAKPISPVAFFEALQAAVGGDARAA